MPVCLSTTFLALQATRQLSIGKMANSSVFSASVTTASFSQPQGLQKMAFLLGWEELFFKDDAAGTQSAVKESQLVESPAGESS